MLIVSELSRIGRDTMRTPGAILQLEESGVEIHSYLSGAPISLANEAGEMSTVLHSLLASFERRRAPERTYDALRRRAEAGAVTGGRVFGYLNHRNGDGYVHRVIHPTAIRDMLRRSLYAGTVTWNRTQKGMRGGTKSWRIRASAEWMERPAPELESVTLSCGPACRPGARRPAPRSSAT